jgi:hypothetical protein
MYFLLVRIEVRPGLEYGYWMFYNYYCSFEGMVEARHRVVMAAVMGIAGYKLSNSGCAAGCSIPLKKVLRRPPGLTSDLHAVNSADYFVGTFDAASALAATVAAAVLVAWIEEVVLTLALVAGVPVAVVGLGYGCGHFVGCLSWQISHSVLRVLLQGDVLLACSAETTPPQSLELYLLLWGG